MKKRTLLLIVCILTTGLVSPGFADIVSLRKSVSDALTTNPRLKALQHSRDAVQYDLRQSQGEYLPSVDLSLGYGTDQYSSRTSRLSTSDPGDGDWDRRGEATISLIQKIYDSGVGSRIDIREALVRSAEYRVFDNAQSIALDAVIAHLDVFRQRELVDLSEKNVQLHRDILKSLESLRDAGAGSVADVSQVQGRLARSLSSLSRARADLAAAEAGYLRVVGEKADNVSFAAVPELTPVSLDEALAQTKEGNPKVLALSADIEEADARIKLAKVNMKPRLNLELSSRYTDQADADPSWTFANEAMLRLRWNIFNGGQDHAAVRAAARRELQRRSQQNDRLDIVLNETRATWAEYLSAEEQIDAYCHAVNYNEKTLDSYLKQFNVAQRSLLDVLDAANEFFQTGGQLVTSSVNKTIAAYRLLALSGRLVVSDTAGSSDQLPEYLQKLRNDVSVHNVAAESTDSTLAAAVPVNEKNVQDDSSESSVRDFLDNWSTAWQNQDFDAYLKCYSKKFNPEGGQNIQGWKNSRKRYLSQREYIRLSLNNIELTQVSEEECRAGFLQSYTSNLYHDRVQKVLHLKRENDRWVIVREISNPL